MDPENLSEQATRVAWLYYDRGLNQGQIAKRLDVSRSTISRLLAHARRTGIVEISINRQVPEVAAIESALHDRFTLKVAAVEQSDPGESPSDAAARAGARYLVRAARGSRTIGIGWGSTLRALAQHVTRPSTTGQILIDAVGRPPSDDSLAPASRLIARTWPVEVVPISAPAFAATPEVRNELLRNTVVQQALERARRSDLILVSVGGTDADATLVGEGVIAKATMRRLAKAGAVGDILGHFYDARGREVNVPGLMSPIGLDLDDLHAATLVVAVAAGPAKVNAIAAALDASLVDGIITDDSTGRALLQA